jgi:hypothetical protein
MTALSITLALVAVVAAALAGVALSAWRRAVRAAVRRGEAAEQDLAELRERLAVLEHASTRPDLTSDRLRPGSGQREFVITRLGEGESAALERLGDRAPVRVSLSGPAFADAIVRETVVQTASLVQGLRHALAAETRNRIRFEMKRELKRSRKARKVELKEALREYRARHRADVPADRRADISRDLPLRDLPDEGVA